MKRIHAVTAAVALSVAPMLIGPGLAAADQRTQPAGTAKPIDYVIQRALSQRGVPYVYGGGTTTGPTNGSRAASALAAPGVAAVAESAPAAELAPTVVPVPGATVPGAVPGIAPGALASPATVGFDSSGLIQYAFAAAGIKMPRTSGEQCNVGRKVPPAQARPGDLICFGPGGSQSVALYLGNNQMIEGTEPAVTVSRVRTRSMVPYLTRVIES